MSIGQTNSLALCPAMTTHSEMSEAALEEAGIKKTTMRIAVGLEDPRLFLAHFITAARITIEPQNPGFCDLFPNPSEIDSLYVTTFGDITSRHNQALPGIADLMG